MKISCSSSALLRNGFWILLFLPVSAQAQMVSPGTIPPPQIASVDSNGVDITTGWPLYQQLELSIGGSGVGALQYIRYFSGGISRTNIDTFYDYVWPAASLLPQRSVFTLGNSTDVAKDNISTLATGAEFFPDGNNYQVTGIYKKKDGTSVSFTHIRDLYWNSGDITAHVIADYIEYRDGVRWTYYYEDVYIPGIANTAVRLKSLVSNTGYQLKFFYRSNTANIGNIVSWSTVSKVIAINNSVEYCDYIANTCSLSVAWPEVNYPNTGLPSGYNLKVVDPAGGETLYKTGTTFAVRLPNSSVDNRSYTSQSLSLCPSSPPQWKVVSATINGATTTYAHSCASVTSTGPQSEHNTYAFTVVPGAPYSTLPGVDEYIDPNSNEYKYQYQPSTDLEILRTGNITKAEYPEGNYIQYARNSVGDITQAQAVGKPGSGVLNIVESRTIGPFGEPTSITDPNNNTTTYTYDAVHGGTLTATAPLVGGIAAVKRYSYAQRYAWVKNSGGTYVQAATPVWLMTEERTCKTTATVGNSCSGGPGDEVLVSYDYGPNSGPNNLQLRGKIVTADGISLRTCYGYDIYGNKISETSPRAGLTSCP